MNWDTIIAVVIILALVLGFWARIARQTIPEVVMGIIDAIRGKAEDGKEYVQETMIYD